MKIREIFFLIGVLVVITQGTNFDRHNDEIVSKNPADVLSIPLVKRETARILIEKDEKIGISISEVNKKIQKTTSKKPRKAKSNSQNNNRDDVNGWLWMAT